jgi:cbb3-type cytochrome oxidase maturation protein
MNVLLMLILVSLALAVMALIAFLWAANSGQFEDTSTPSMRVLTDDPAPAKPSNPPERDKPITESGDKKS